MSGQVVLESLLESGLSTFRAEVVQEGDMMGERQPQLMGAANGQQACTKR